MRIHTDFFWSFLCPIGLVSELQNPGPGHSKAILAIPRLGHSKAILAIPRLGPFYSSFVNSGLGPIHNNFEIQLLMAIVLQKGNSAHCDLAVKQPSSPYSPNSIKNRSPSSYPSSPLPTTLSTQTSLSKSTCLNSSRS